MISKIKAFEQNLCYLLNAVSLLQIDLPVKPSTLGVIEFCEEAMMVYTSLFCTHPVWVKRFALTYTPLDNSSKNTIYKITIKIDIILHSYDGDCLRIKRLHMQ